VGHVLTTICRLALIKNGRDNNNNNKLYNLVPISLWKYYEVMVV
jgi:hypothetical protein